MDIYLIIAALAGVSLMLLLSARVVRRKRVRRPPEVRIKFDQYKCRELISRVEGQR